jgi:hypothetical protein
MKNNSLEVTLSKMREYIRKEVAGGFSSADEICRIAVEIYADKHNPSILLPYAKTLFQEMIDAQFREQAAWEETTDCDRLDQAFIDLEKQGIISRQNYSCCGTCGSGEIWEVMVALQSEGKKVRGYTFYHEQDTQQAVDGEGLYLNYGSIEENVPAQIEIGHEIVQVLNQHDLATDWNGELQYRIFVKLKWRRRR